jgi:hypothetical protein
MRKGRHATSRKSKPGDLKDIQEEAPRSRTGNKKGTGEEEATLLGGSGRDDRTPRKKDKGTPRSLTTPASLSEVAPDTAHGANSASIPGAAPRRRGNLPPFQVAPLAAVRTYSRQPLPDPVTHAEAARRGRKTPLRPRHLSGGRHWDISEYGVPTPFAARGLRLVSHPSQGRTGPRPLGAHRAPPARPLWEGFPLEEGAYLKIS